MYSYFLGSDSCGGDSGGPMVLRKPGGAWYQMGVVSFGSKKCGLGKPAVYTRVTAYLDWIKDNMKP